MLNIPYLLSEKITAKEVMVIQLIDCLFKNILLLCNAVTGLKIQIHMHFFCTRGITYMYVPVYTHM